MKHLDCTGLTCPGPVIQVKKTLEQTPGGVSFSVDVASEASLDNVRRFAQSRGAAVRWEKTAEGSYRLVITAPSARDTDTQADGGADRDTPREGIASGRPPVILITGDTVGKGDDKLGSILMEGFINTLLEQEGAPDRILLMNAGVNLAVEGSAVISSLEALVDRGCEILVCGTCLDFFSLKDRLLVGTVSNMFEIQRALLEADRAVKI